MSELALAKDSLNAIVSCPGRRHEDESIPARTLLSSYYRCPKGLLGSLLASGPLSEDKGYFRFGGGTAYGRLAAGNTVPSPGRDMQDVLDQVIVGNHDVRLPFDAPEIVENLLRERYTAHFREEGRMWNELLRKAYYMVRPYLGVPIRRTIQKAYLRGWNNIAFPSWPVDTTVENIHKRLLALLLKAMGLRQLPFIWFWPDGYSNCLIMTHDVEDSSGKEFCSKLMDMDEAAGLRSSFQIVPEDRYPVSQNFLASITNRGFEVNVHDLKHDGRLYAEHCEFLRRAARVNEYIKEFGAEGFRSGILYRNADWYDAFEFSYDMSIPNVAHLDPQRGGCCTVLPYFIGNIVELPLTCTQDYTLFHILNDYSLELWKRQVSLISCNYGLVSFVVHPDYIIAPQARRTYEALLNYLSELHAAGQTWHALPREVAAWWRERAQMELVPKGEAWQVEGPGKGRARVAYASLSGDSVTYSFEADEIPSGN